MTLEELKIYNPVIDDELYQEALEVCENDAEITLIALNIVKNYELKKDMIEIIKTSKSTANFMKKCGAGEVSIPKIVYN